MTRFGQILSTVNLNTDGGVLSNFLTLAAPVSTTSASLENITGFSFSLTLAETARILAIMTVEADSTDVGTSATGAWAISINSVDGGEIGRFLNGTNDLGSVTCLFRSASLSASAYTIQGRHYRRSGDKTVTTQAAYLFACVVI